MLNRLRSIPPGVVVGGLAAVALVAVFVQIERGTGNVALSLLFVGHNLMMCAALGLACLLLTRRPWTSVFAGVAIVLLVWFASYLKVAATDIPAFASDLPRLLDTWDVVVDFGWPALAATAACAASLALV